MPAKKKGPVDLVKERCVLVYFSSGYYNWIRRDKTTERELAQSKGVRRDTWETHKNIFVGADALMAQAKSLVNEARAYHYDTTLPWQHRVSAVLANPLVPEYREHISGFQSRMDHTNDSLRVEWKHMQTEAKRILGPAYNPADYPSVDKVIESNYIRTKFSAVTDGEDIRSTVNGDALDDIRSEVNADAEVARSAAMRALWERIYTVITAANANLQKLNSDDGRFRLEWYDNLQSLLAIITNLNIGDDKRVEEIKLDAEKLLRYSPDVLKEDIDVREKLSKEAEKIYERVSSIFVPMGGK